MPGIEVDAFGADIGGSLKPHKGPLVGKAADDPPGAERYAEIAEDRLAAILEFSGDSRDSKHGERARRKRKFQHG
jgi:hypothetical protein